MISRRQFLKLTALVGTVAGAPPVLLAESQSDVAGWRFGVWTITKRYGVRHGQNYYWCRCDCGAERVVRLNQLLSQDALSCAHVRRRGVLCISADAMRCQNCVDARRFFFNGDGMRIWRCGNCEEADIRAYLRLEYDSPSTSIQFLANMRRVSET